jgi:hypothetical protein
MKSAFAVRECSRETPMRSDAKRTAKGAGKKKQSILASGSTAKKGAREAEMAAGGSSNPGLQSSHRKTAISRADVLKPECDFRDVAEYRIEAGCHYEYFRESAAMRKSCVLPTSMLFSVVR